MKCNINIVSDLTETYTEILGGIKYK